MAKIVSLKAARRSSELRGAPVFGVSGGRSVIRGGSTARKHDRAAERGHIKVISGASDRDARYKRRAQVLLYQAASLLAEVEGSEQRLAWLLEDCADLLVREDTVPPVA